MIGIIAAAAILLLIILFWTCYVQAPPSTALVISGLAKNPRILVGTGGFKIPLLERKDAVYLGQIGVDIRTKELVPTLDFINVNIDAVAKVQALPTPDGIRLAAKNFLNMPPDKISEQLQDTLEANMREIIGTIDLKNLNTNRDAFAQKVLESAVKDMEQLGIKILCLNIQNITDKYGLISDLGADNTAAIKKNAAITKANADKEVAVAVANADREANDARVAADEAIAERNNQLALKKADLKKVEDTRQAMADAAYEIEKQRQLKEVNAVTVEAEIEQTMRRQKLEEENVKVTDFRLRSEVNKKAEADKFAVETRAAAELEQQKRIAEAKAYQAEQDARAARAKAEAELYAAQHEAEACRAKADAAAFEIERTGKAEAEAIRLKGEAEAKAMEKKAEAYKKYEGAAVIEMLAGILPEVAAKVAEPISSIKDLRVYGGDASSVSGNVPAVLKQTLDVVQSATGVDLSGVIKEKAHIANVKLD